MMCGVELVDDKQTKAPATRPRRQGRPEALARGLLTRFRGGGANPAIGDTICIAPPLMTPEETIDRIRRYPARGHRRGNPIGAFEARPRVIRRRI